MAAPGQKGADRPRVVHVREFPYDVYIGRRMPGLPASKWANPYHVGQHGTRAECVAKFEAYLRGRPELMADLHELDGLVLGCWCKTKARPRRACHGDVLLKVRAEQLAREGKADGDAAGG